MNKIKILPKNLADKIAAGEVVERPASVVKELVENSIDAGASEIDIYILDTGKKMIKIIDNGSGMPLDDLKIACQRHSTSKIETALDLEKINTLGFRGEALSSIAAVSFLSITSSTVHSSLAWTIKVEGGLEQGIYQTARSKGTTIEVRNLFFNTPARLKFLKTKATEMFHLIRVVTELSLAYPEIGFKLINNDTEIINLLAQGSLLDRIRALLGEELAEQLVPVSFAVSPLEIRGFISRPGFNHTNRKNQFIFVNNRSITDKTISHAIIQAYQTFKMEKQFPSLIIFIHTLPELIDVNVHPGKREIRFQDSAVLHDLLVKVIRDALTDKNRLPEFAGAGNYNYPQSADMNQENTIKEHNENNYSLKRDYRPAVNYAPQSVDKELFHAARKDTFALNELEPLRDCLQVKSTYIIFEDKDGLEIVDQHAAHERILFDQLLKQFQSKRVETQKLLLPVTLNFSKAQMVLFNEYAGMLRDLGFEVDEFGDKTVAVYAYPAILGEINIGDVFTNIIAELIDGQETADLNKEVSKLLAPIACHSAVRANQKLNTAQINALLDQLWNTDAPYTCPHGRPTVTKIGWKELEKMFKRR
ncbi:MAG: DNA mismatch repair endonuclease MutL [Candidatus Omnitrophota bacterium]|nr:MAG: DNA mismatch repair endonuclease MutL [Candidatus Omnitrophota bacterium]